MLNYCYLCSEKKEHNRKDGMKGSLKRDYNYSVIITAEDLIELSDLIKNDFIEVSYEIKTKDGARYRINSIDEVLEYNNSDSRKIEMLSIIGNKEIGAHPLLPDICISLFDSSVFDKSCLLELNRMEEKEIVFYTKRIDEFVKKIRAPYWWIHKDGFYWVIGFVLYFILAFLYFSHNSNQESNKTYNILLLQGVFAFCLGFSMFVLNKIVSFFYPAGCFAIGEQKKHKAKKEKARSIVILTILGATVLGVLSNIIAHYFIIKVL